MTAEVRHLDRSEASTRHYDRTDASTRLLNRSELSTRHLDRTDASTRLLNRSELSTRHLDRSEASTRLLDRSELSTRHLDRSEAKWRDPRIAFLLLLLLVLPSQAQQPHFNGPAAYSLTQQFLAAAPKRFNGSPGHAAAEAFLKAHFAPEAAKGNLETDSFTSTTPAGAQAMRNYIVKYPGKRDGIIVLASHYETNYNLRDTAFVGANDGAATSALLIEIGAILRTHSPEGYSVWLVFDDGEESITGNWSEDGGLYGTRHLAAKWANDGTLARIKALIVADMCADRDLNILRETESTPWLLDTLQTAAKNTGHTASIFKNSGGEIDDHIPFKKRGVPVLDFIDSDYGPHTAATPDGWHHTDQDTLDKVSARSLLISGDLLLEMIRLINQR